MRNSFTGLFLALVMLQAGAADEKRRWWSAEVEQSLAKAGCNRPELLKALNDVPAEQRKEMSFLLMHLSEQDCKSLSSNFLLENVALACKARQQFPWGRKLSDDLFLNEVLPHANLDESRDPWRKELHELCDPLVKDCKSMSEAAQVLNSTIFPKLKVRYSTERKKANQSPKESIESGKASCSGLSILLCDACRSVAIPARLAGTPLWANKRGNHTWVEVWDNGWHFTGAAEPDPKGLDRAWFQGAASEAQADSRLHAIYAVSFKKTSVTFPLVWAEDRKDVFAENVTSRYAKAKPVDQIEKAAGAFFSAKEAERAKFTFDPALDQLLLTQEEAVRHAVWKAYQSAPIHEELKKDFAKNEVRNQKQVSPYVVRKVGKRPERGWPLFIALHGGGGAPKELNDSQWKIMERYYNDQQSVTGYQYLALRAPNDAWNGFYDDNMTRLMENLIRQFVLLGDVDPDKVYLMGYSHGGYGAFYLGPRIPYRFAAVHSSAAAPSDGTNSARNLRNMRFTFMIGEKDTAYGRIERCEGFNKVMQKLKDENKGDYPVDMQLIKGAGHGGLPDRDKIKEMYPSIRNPAPRRLSWELIDGVVRQFYWLSVSEPGGNRSLDATINDKGIDITTRNVKEFALHLDGRLVKFDKPLRVVVDGKSQEVKLTPRLETVCQSLLERGDPALAFSCRVPLQSEKK